MAADGSPRVSVHNLTRGRTIARSMRVARTARERMIGLLRTPEQDLGDGLLIEHAPSVHMLFMRYPIDALFISADGHVTKTVPRLEPWSVVWWAPGARDCLELPAGRLADSGTQVGDKLEVSPAAE